MAVSVTPSCRLCSTPRVGRAKVPCTTSGVGAYWSVGAASGAGNVDGGSVVVGGSVDADAFATAPWVAAVVDVVAGVSSSSVSAQPPVTPAPTRSSARTPIRKRAGRRTDTAGGRETGVGR
jgi:hypothetical protein